MLISDHPVSARIPLLRRRDGPPPNRALILMLMLMMMSIPTHWLIVLIMISLMEETRSITMAMTVAGHQAWLSRHVVRVAGIICDVVRMGR